MAAGDEASFFEQRCGGPGHANLFSMRKSVPVSGKSACPSPTAPPWVPEFDPLGNGITLGEERQHGTARASARPIPVPWAESKPVVD